MATTTDTLLPTQVVVGLVTRLTDGTGGAAKASSCWWLTIGGMRLMIANYADLAHIVGVRDKMDGAAVAALTYESWGVPGMVPPVCWVIPSHQLMLRSRFKPVGTMPVIRRWLVQDNRGGTMIVGAVSAAQATEQLSADYVPDDGTQPLQMSHPGDQAYWMQYQHPADDGGDLDAVHVLAATVMEARTLFRQAFPGCKAVDFDLLAPTGVISVETRISELWKMSGTTLPITPELPAPSAPQPEGDATCPT